MNLSDFIDLMKREKFRDEQHKDWERTKKETGLRGSTLMSCANEEVHWPGNPDTSGKER